MKKLIASTFLAGGLFAFAGAAQADCGDVSIAEMNWASAGVGTTLLLSGIGSAILFKVVDVIVGLRVSVDAEREGLDITDHTERAYNM